MPINFGDQEDGAGNFGKRRQMVLDQGSREVGNLLVRIASAYVFQVLRRQQRQLRKDIGRDHKIGIVLGSTAGSGKRKGTPGVSMDMVMNRFDNASEIMVEKADVRQAARLLPLRAQMQNIDHHHLAKKASKIDKRNVVEKPRTKDHRLPPPGRGPRRLNDQPPAMVEMFCPGPAAALLAGTKRDQLPQVTHFAQMPGAGRDEMREPFGQHGV